MNHKMHKQSSELSLTFHLPHPDEETVDKVPRIVNVQGCLVLLYFLQSKTVKISNIFKYFVMTPWEKIKENRETIAELKEKRILN